MRPRFGPTTTVSLNGGYTKNLDDDDLPEFDYGVSVPYQPEILPSNQLPPEICSLQSLSSTQSPSCEESVNDPVYWHTDERDGVWQPFLVPV